MLNALHALIFKPPKDLMMLGTIIIPILEIWKLKG